MGGDLDLHSVIDNAHLIRADYIKKYLHTPA